jgi:hypothetical protein
MTAQTSATSADKPVVLFLSHGISKSELVRVTFDKRPTKGIGYFRRRTIKPQLGDLAVHFFAEMVDATESIDNPFHGLDKDNGGGDFDELITKTAIEQTVADILAETDLQSITHILVRSRDIYEPFGQYVAQRESVIEALGLHLQDLRLSKSPTLLIVVEDDSTFNISEITYTDTYFELC